MGIIEKRAICNSSFLRTADIFPNARSAFKSILIHMGVPAEGGVLLPAYIGWSPREGSGVFDPIKELNAPFAFYRMNRALNIDLDSLEHELISIKPRAILLIHYFGYPDPNYLKAAELAKNSRSLVIEDEAHSLFSDLIGRTCGRTGEGAFFSLHKMLPLDSGGLALYNDRAWRAGLGKETDLHTLDIIKNIFEYDLASISEKRRRNAAYLLERLTTFSPYLHLLRPQLPAGVVPQTLPVLLKRAPRNEIYEAMNQAGYGVVSLYHTLIREITSERYPDAHWVSDRILNLPVHQDASLESLDLMLSLLFELLGRWD
jgi:dTDP-4-amino-4,6-dideoxygalactose transaminase